jgi:predicted dehydrogenase
MENVKLGVIGTNFVSDWLCESVAASRGIECAAVCSRTEEKGGEFAAKHGIPAVYTDMEAFLSSDIDAVYIASPNFLHYPQATAAVRHGKHVLVEKPACLNRLQFEHLAAEAERAGVVVLEAMRPGHDPAMETARAAIGRIGAVRRAVFDFCQYSSRYDRFRNGEILNAFNPALGNAALMDIGVYAVHSCVMLFGEPESVYARSVILHNGMEGMGTAFLTYPGCQAEIVWSKITESACPSTITGEDGAVLLGKLSTVESVTLAPRGKEKTVLLADRKENNMVYEIADFVKAVRGEADPAPWQKNTALTLAVMDEIRAQNGIVFPGE